MVSLFEFYDHVRKLLYGNKILIIVNDCNKVNNIFALILLIIILMIVK